MPSVVTVENRNGFSFIRINHPPVNALSHAVRQGLLNAINGAIADPSVKGMVLSGSGAVFIAGADIREFGQAVRPPSLPELIAAIEQSEKPVIAAVHGVALGGGLEVCLGCHYRIATPGAKLGLPEVALGIIPGAGGTQRLPRLVGVEIAADMITSGRHVPAGEAATMGLIDAIATGNLEGQAAGFLQENLSNRLRPLSQEPSPSPEAEDFFETGRKRIEAKSRGQISPVKALEMVEVACNTDFDQGIEKEREAFIELRDSDQSKALRHVFFAERAVSKVTALKGISPRLVNNVAVIGGGTMGSGIATALIMAGLSVSLVERDEESAGRAVNAIDQNLQGFVDRLRLSNQKKQECLGRLDSATRMESIRHSELVIEAVFEDLAVKQSVFDELDEVMNPDAVLATNTSYLNIDEICQIKKRQPHFVGLHFFSPAQVMKLVEVVKTEATSPETLATCMSLAKRLGKIGVLAGAGDGFIGNRILAHWRKQADYLVEDGALPWEVDAAMEAFGMTMGPYKVMDLAGLDISWAMRKSRAEFRDPAERYVRIADQLCKRGWFGRKSGKGWYLYQDGQILPNPEVEQIVLVESTERGIVRKLMRREVIQRRIMMAMINEASKLLEEGIAQRPLDIDLVKIHGYGFPRWRGGPMYYADSFGLDRVLECIREYAVEDSYHWQPASLLEQLVVEGKSFADLN